MKRRHVERGKADREADRARLFYVPFVIGAMVETAAEKALNGHLGWWWFAGLAAFALFLTFGWLYIAREVLAEPRVPVCRCDDCNSWRSE